MNKLMTSIVAAAFVLGAFADEAFQVKNVEAHQRYPWNGKVDIDFLIDCADSTAEFDVTVECTDHIGNTNVTMRTIKENDTGVSATKFRLKNGQHRLVWNADVDCPNVKLANITFTVFAKLVEGSDSVDYLVIDLSGGPDATAYPVSYRTGVPDGGWTDEYKATKLVMRKCPAGKDLLGRYTLSKDFYAGVFEVTQKQWLQVMGSWPSTSPSSSCGVGDTYPAYYVSYDHVRGNSEGSRWPESSAVDATSFIGRIRAKTGLKEFDLPTEAQWECACRAGTTTDYNTGDGEAALAIAGWYLSNSGGTTHPAGSKTANAWGLYDMHGNVMEHTLDWFLSGESPSGSDPKGATAGKDRCFRGGSRGENAHRCASSYRFGVSPSVVYSHLGFRLFRTCP